jgi:hypothetical protein
MTAPACCPEVESAVEREDVLTRTRVGRWSLVLLFLVALFSVNLAAQQPASAPTAPVAAASGADQPFVVEYYYKTKWGHADEFITLFKKNHLPLLQKQIELGRLLQVTATAPRYHTTEDGRWDYRVMKQRWRSNYSLISRPISVRSSADSKFLTRTGTCRSRQ